MRLDTLWLDRPIAHSYSKAHDEARAMNALLDVPKGLSVLHSEIFIEY